MTSGQHERLVSSEDDRERISSIMAALGDSCRLGVVVNLLEQPCTQKQLAGLHAVNSGVMSRHMAVLEDTGLVTRERSHGPYSLTAPAETLELLLAAAQLSVIAAETHLEATAAWQERIAALAVPPGSH